MGQQLQGVVQHLRRVGLMPDGAGLGDDQLLQRFLENGDEAAFACLVHRHGPMIMGVCRRILGNVQDAEDAFQATFLALVRKAACVHGGVLPAWLHSVAYRTALGARTAERRRRARERTVFKPEAAQTNDSRDWRELLDRELAGLPEKYRAAIVLCNLQGKSRRDAARQLGWKEGTLSGRLARARTLLARRLSRYGPSLSATGLTALCTEEAAVSASVASATVRAAAALASGNAAAISAKVIILTEGALRAMAATKLKLALVIVVLGGALTAVAGLLADPRAVPAQRPAEEGRPARVASQLLATTAPVQRPRTFHPFFDDDKVQQAVARGLSFLKKAQTAAGTWEVDVASAGMRGGWTSLAVLALLRSGVSADDPSVKKGLDYLRGLKPESTYVVSLQMAVFARTHAKKDLPILQRNVSWLLDAAQRRNGKFVGWSYQKRGVAAITDNSNTQFAVMALDEAHQVGASVEAKVWKEIQQYYLNTGLATGGWSYQSQRPDAGASLTMTAAGLCGLAITGLHLKNTAEIKTALDNATRQIGLRYEVALPQATFYSLYGMARAGRLVNRREFVANEKHDWFREGASFLLQTQRENGAWHGNGAFDRWEVVSTSLALLFFAQGK